MQSLKEFYKVGPGPSSSHTIGPQRAAQRFSEAFPCASKIIVTLHGSLSLTGKGHLTDKIILDTIKNADVEILWDDDELPGHPNGMIFRAFDALDEMIGQWIVYSVGGGTIVIDGLQEDGEVPELYKLNKLDDIYDYVTKNNIDLFDYIVEEEGQDIVEFLGDIFEHFIANTKRGIQQEGMLPGVLNLERVAKSIHEQALKETDETKKNRMLLMAYAYGNSEENGSGGYVVTAPTCGACGVMPAFVYHYYNDLGYSKEQIVKAIGVAGLFGNLVKHNAAISGAEGGCQSEVGTAVSMAAAGAAYIEGLSLKEIEYAAELAMEHHLGLTCDPVEGYVQVPCISRNAQGILRAMDAKETAKLIGNTKGNKISFDAVVRTMKETGDDLKIEYRETALGGLAKNYYINNKLK